MHSIIDEITEVEAHAAKIRQDAAVAARDSVAKAQEDADKQLATQADFARNKLREASQKAELEGAELGARILAERSAETNAACDTARGKLPDAVKYLVGRVVS